MTRQLMETVVLVFISEPVRVRFAWHDDDNLKQLGQPTPRAALDGPSLALVETDAA